MVVGLYAQPALWRKRMLNLDIDGFLTSTQFLATLAGFLTAIISAVFTNFIGGIFGTTA